MQIRQIPLTYVQSKILEHIVCLAHISLGCFYGTYANIADLDQTDQTPHNAVSDQELHCLLTESSIKIWKKYHQTPLKLEMHCFNW